MSTTIIYAPFLLGMLYASWHDFKHQTIPDFITIGGFVLGIVISWVFPEIHGEEVFIYSLQKAFTGAFIGSGTLLWIAILGETALKKEVMGFGDIKLMGCIGSFLGWKGALCSIFAGSLIGSVCIGLYLVFHRIKAKEWALDRPFPYGPWLVSGAFLYLLSMQSV